MIFSGNSICLRFILCVIPIRNTILCRIVSFLSAVLKRIPPSLLCRPIFISGGIPVLFSYTAFGWGKVPPSPIKGLLWDKKKRTFPISYARTKIYRKSFFFHCPLSSVWAFYRHTVFFCPDSVQHGSNISVISDIICASSIWGIAAIGVTLCLFPDVLRILTCIISTFSSTGTKGCNLCLKADTLQKSFSSCATNPAVQFTCILLSGKFLLSSSAQMTLLWQTSIRLPLPHTRKYVLTGCYADFLKLPVPVK